MDRTGAVTGGSKLGRAVLAALIDDGWTLINFDRVPSPDSRARFIRTDLTDYGQRSGLVARNSVSWHGKLAVPVLASGGGAQTLSANYGPMCEEVAIDVTSHLVPDAGHWVAEENSDYFCRLFIDFRHLNQNQTRGGCGGNAQWLPEPARTK